MPPAESPRSAASPSLTGTRAALEVLDRHGAAAAVVSLFDSGAAGGDGDLMRVLARESNHFYAELLTRHPRRFGAFAVLPLPDVDAALAELAHALDVLGLDGVMLLSNYAGRYLGDPLLRPGLLSFVCPGQRLVAVEGRHSRQLG